MVTSFILSSPDFYYLEDKYETLQEATDTHTVSQREERQLDGGGDFTGSLKIIAYPEEGVPYDYEKDNTQYPCKGVDDGLLPLGEHNHKKLHVNLLPLQCDGGKTETDHQSEG
jgi:hypothetical protein